ncbi:MAG: hypothetical protein NVS3B17_07060 [Vulcanimicrobiaceae bacterium]
MRPSAALRAGALASVVALCASGCTRQEVDKAGSDFASAAPALANDGLIVAQIEAAFVRIDGDSALHVAVASHDGRVRLSGRAKSAAVVAGFIDAARHVAGVRAVTSNVTADPRVPSTKKAVADFALVTAVRASLVGQAGVNALGIGIDASDGKIVLRGRVKTSAVRTTLEDAARTTAGVRAVDDRLEVAS